MQKALLVDRNYMALSIITWKKAVSLLVRGKAEAIETGNTTAIGSGTGPFHLSSILRLVVDIPWRAHKSRMRFSRKNVMIRDNHECQYCGKRLGKTNNTIDHVIPRAQRGETSYTNCVACCRECNNKKGDKTPQQAGMPLRTKPKKPGFLVMYRHYLDKHSPEEWSDYIIGL